jgi:hypothetical protein
VLPSGTASQVSVTGNTRYGSGETDLSGAEVVFGNKGFGADRTENNLIVGGQLTVNGNIVMVSNSIVSQNLNDCSSDTIVDAPDNIGRYIVITGNIPSSSTTSHRVMISIRSSIIINYEITGTITFYSGGLGNSYISFSNTTKSGSFKILAQRIS